MAHSSKLTLHERKLELISKADEQRRLFQKGITIIKKEATTLCSISFLSQNILKSALSLLSPKSKHYKLIKKPASNYLLAFLSSRKNKIIRLGALAWMNYRYYKTIRSYFFLMKRGFQDIISYLR